MPRSNRQFMGTKKPRFLRVAKKKKRTFLPVKNKRSVHGSDVFYVSFVKKKEFKKDRTHLLLSNEFKIEYATIGGLAKYIICKLHKDNVIEVDH